MFDLFWVCHKDYFSGDLCLILNATVAGQNEEMSEIETGAERIREVRERI